MLASEFLNEGFAAGSTGVQFCADIIEGCGGDLF
jgi:hypothetical protein